MGTPEHSVLTRTAIEFVRAAVALLAISTILNLGLRFLTGTEPGWYWMELGAWPGPLALGLELAFATSVLARPWLKRSGRNGARWIVGLCAVVCTVDATRVACLVAGGDLHQASPVPSSAVFACVLAAWVRCAGSPGAGAFSWAGATLRAGVLATVLGIGVLATAWTYGFTDYRRDASAIVVFGAKVEANGEPSLPLADRVRKACELYHAGLAPKIVMSGGHGSDSPRSEAQAMAGLAVELGVPRAAIVLDEEGHNTLASMRVAQGLAAERGWDSLLCVSHAYHLARVKLFAERLDLPVRTVPADETRIMRAYPWFLAREAAALLYWYLDPRTFDLSRSS